MKTQEMTPATNPRENVFHVPISEVDDFPEHPFRVCTDTETQAMAESIRVVGIQTPLVTRQKEDGRYEIVSGHRRKLAAVLAGVDTLPVIVRELTRDQAIIAMVDSNLQRENILPSEKAKSYKMKLEAMKRQGQRTDLTSSPLGMKLENTQSLDKVGDANGDSRNQVHRYIRLTELIPEIMQMVDDGKIAFRPAVELSYLTKGEQTLLLSAMQSEQATPSLSQAQRIKQLSAGGKLNADSLPGIMQEEKPNQREQVKLPYDQVRKFFPARASVEDIIREILKLLEQRQRSRDRGAR